MFENIFYAYLCMENMDKNLWQKINSIVNEALSLDRKERVGFISSICGNDQRLYREVTDLLTSIDESENLWDELFESNHILMNDLPESHTSEYSTDISESLKKIGPYHLIRRIGRGGMGDVWLAERDDGQFDQQVAIKIVRPDIGQQENYQRFQQERQIMASLNHPNIARLLDGGISNTGHPYLVLEYVKGVSITEYCTSLNGSLERRLELFALVCKAIQYAHRNLIVHRDLKPDNILVTKDGTLKVLDFGIAKLLDSELTSRTLIETRTGLRMMSLNYATPEQISMEPITTATDVYALGLLLYELLTDARPFDLHKKKLSEAEQIIRKQDPVKPSRLDTRWKKELKGDLDAIILKALRKEPEQRYESAGHMMDDIHRYEKNLPVCARNDTFRYRASKFIKRYSVIIFSVVTILLIATAFGFYHTWQMTKERNIAKTEAEKAQQITDFLIDVFEYSNPTIKNPHEITAREILDHGADFIRNSLTDQPEIQAEMMNAIGRIYTNLGLYNEAKPMLFEAMEINKEFSSEQELAFTLRNLGDLYSNLGFYDSSAIYLQDAITRLQANENNTELAGSIESLGWVLYTMGNYEKADSLLTKAMSIQQELHGEKSIEVAQNMQLRAWVQHDLGHYDIAENLFRQVLALRRSLLGPEHRDVATTLHSLGWVLYQKKEYALADSIMRKALDLREQLYPEGHMDVAWSQNNMGLIQQALGNFKEAERLFNSSLEMRKAILGEEHSHVAQSLGNLAGLYFSQQKYRKAASMFEKVIKIDLKRLGENHPQLAVDYNNLATVLNNSGQKRQSLEYYQKALSIIGLSLPASHPNVVHIADNMAAVHLDLKDFEKAEQLYLSTFEALREEEGLEDQLTQVIARRLTEFYTITSEPEKASFYRSLTESPQE